MKTVSVLVFFCLVASAAARRDLSQTVASASASSSSSSSSGTASSVAVARSGPAAAGSSSAESARTAGIVDVYCLVDNTEKKQNTNFVGELAANARQLVDGLFAGASNPRFGLGIYSDNAQGGFSFTNLLNLTSDQASAISEVSKLSAKNTSFPQESQFFALQAVATRGAIGFRGRATKIVVWLGNRGGKDPVGGSTEASATSALTGGNFRVVAIDTERLNAAGQASRIAAATNGIFYKVNGDGRFRTLALSQTGDSGSSAASASATGDATVVSTTVDGQTTTVRDPVNLIDAILDGVFALGS